MADENNEDSWLYGSGEKKPEGDPAADAAEEPEEGEIDSTSKDDEKNEEPAAGGEDAIEEKEEGCPNAADEMEEQDGAVATTQPGAERDDENSEDSDEDDDDINVVIGNIKSGPSYNIKQRGGTAAGTAPAGTTAEKAAKQASGKFNIEEFESIGTISGVPAHEFSIDSLDEKPWRKPGADITDYFNYGFNEETWRMYCERQKRMRQSESGAGLQGLMVHTHQQQQQITVANAQMQHNSVPAGRTLTPIANDNSKYGTQPMPISMINRRQAGPPPGRRLTGVIDVIGGNGMSEGGRPGGGPTKGPGTENAIQVMTAERREYSRPGMPPNVGGKFDMPPPTTIGFPGSGGGGGPPPVVGPNPNHPPHSNSSGAPPLMDPFFEPDAYNYGYEPTQDSQWGPQGNPGWMPTGIKVIVVNDFTQLSFGFNALYFTGINSRSSANGATANEHGNTAAASNRRYADGNAPTWRSYE